MAGSCVQEFAERVENTLLLLLRDPPADNPTRKLLDEVRSSSKPSLERRIRDHSHVIIVWD